MLSHQGQDEILTMELYFLKKNCNSYKALSSNLFLEFYSFLLCSLFSFHHVRNVAKETADIRGRLDVCMHYVS